MSEELVADEDWEEKFSEQHKKKFWKNKKTGKSSWTEPPKVPKKTTSSSTAETSTNVTSETVELVADEDWEEKYSEQHKRKFWKNKTTGKSSWTEPPKVPKKTTGGGKTETATATATTAGTAAATSASSDTSTTQELVADEDWEEKYSEQHKRKFWKNKTTGKSSWTEPPKVPKKTTTGDAETTTKISTTDDTSSSAVELVPDEDWEEKYSDQHKRKFWKNKKTGKSSWTEPPKVPKTISAAAGASTTAVASEVLVPDEDWEEKYSEQHKKKFWKNKKTGKSSWTEPPKVPKTISASATTPTPTNPLSSTAETSTNVTSETVELVADEDWEEKYSEQHKRKFWKNKTTGKSSWTEPPKVPKKTAGGGKTETATATATTAGTATATAASASSDTSTTQELVADDDWEEKYSEQHKRKFWKNKTTGKSSWTEPPKVPKKTTTGNAETKQSTEVQAASSSTQKVSVPEKPKEIELKTTCGLFWTIENGIWNSFPTKLIGIDSICALILYKDFHNCTQEFTPLEQEIIKEITEKKETYVTQSPLIHLLISFTSFSQLYCNELPGQLRFVQLVNQQQQQQQQQQPIVAQNSLMKSDGTQAVTLLEEVVKSSTISSTKNEIILMCSSKYDACLWTKIFKTKINHLHIYDNTENCINDVDQVKMACIIASTSQDRARTEISWLKNLSQKFTSTVLPQADLQQYLSHLAYLENKVDNLLKLSSGDQSTEVLESNRLPIDGLVVVAMFPSSNFTYPDDYHRGSLAYFTGQYFSLWIQLDDISHRLIFFDHGPANEPCLTLSIISSTRVIIKDITFEQNYLFELHNCELSDGGLINLTFSFSSSLEYWKWAISLADFLQSSSLFKNVSELSTSDISFHPFSANSKFPLPLAKSSQSHPFQNTFNVTSTTASLDKNHRLNHHLKWNNFMLDFAMDSINTITDRNMIRRFLKKYTMTGVEIRTIKFYSVHNRIIISDGGRSTLRIGSVLITLNNISAIGIPGRSISEIIRDIPSHTSVEISCWEFPREIFSCNVLLGNTNTSTNTNSNTNATESLKSGANSYEEKKSNEDNGNKQLQDLVNWVTDVKVKLEGDSLLLIHTTWKRSLSLSNIRMRLIEVDDDLTIGNTSSKTSLLKVSLSVAIELRDKESKILVSCSTIRTLLDFLCRLFEALKLIGTIGYDLTTFHDKCLQYQQFQSQQKLTTNSFLDKEISSLSLSPIPLNHSNNQHHQNQYLTPMKSPLAQLPFHPSSRSDIMKAAHDLEVVFESLHISDSFPTVRNVYEVLNSLQNQHVENHKLLLRLIELEAQSAERSTNSEKKIQSNEAENDNENENDEIDEFSQGESFPIVSRSPFTFDSAAINGVSKKPQFHPLRRSLSQGHVRYNSLLDTTSPHVFVPPADTKERKLSVILPNSRRGSSIGTTGNTNGNANTTASGSSLQSSIPILNEPGMQPLLPLLPLQGDKESTNGTTPVLENAEKKVEVEDGIERKEEGNKIENEKVSQEVTLTKSRTPILELKDRDLNQCSEIFFFLRDHPDLFLDFTRCCESLSELMELIHLYVTRIFAHWSCDESHLLHFINEVVAHHLLPLDTLEDYRTLSDVQKQQQQQQQQRSLSLFTSFKSCELLPLIFDELCGRPDMIGFIKYVSEGVGSSGKVLLANGTNDISLLCSQIVEPICQRLDSVTTSGKLPVALRCMLASIVGQTRDDEKKRSDLFHLFTSSFVPRVTRWLVNSNSQSHITLTDDCVSIGEQTHLLETIQELIKICFTRGVNTSENCTSPSIRLPSSGSNESNHSLQSRSGFGGHGSNFSLQTHAILSRSRWLISRFIEECSIPSIPSSNNQNPVRQMANFVGLKPYQCVSCMSVSGVDIWKTLTRLDKIAENSISIWTTEIRGLLSEVYELIHDDEYLLFWKTNKSSYLLQWNKQDKGDRRYFSTLHSKNQQSYDLSSTSNSSVIRSEDDEYDHPGARELVSINWIINATRNVLKSLYEIQSEIPHDITLYQELISLKESLENRREHIELCLQDIHSLHIFDELIGVYRSELQLLIEMISGDSPPHSNSGDNSGGGYGDGYDKNDEYLFSESEEKKKNISTTHRPHRQHHHQHLHRSEEEYIFSLSKLCHRQFEIEAKISYRSTPQQPQNNNFQPSPSQMRSRVSPMKVRRNGGGIDSTNTSTSMSHSHIHSPASSSSPSPLPSTPSSSSKRRSTTNSLHMLLQNVFPAENLQKKVG